MPIPSFGASSMKILLDTDIGSDIDDAVALAWLLRNPVCELVGITTVTGEAEKRADLARELCRVAGQSIPVFSGIETPLVIPQRQTIAPQATRLKTRSVTRHSGEAIEFLRRTIRANPGQITLLAVGPLTNIAVLFKTDPEIPRLLKQLVLMAGKFSDYPTPWGPTEWNAIVDPHASHIVFSSKPRVLRAFGLDVTWQVSMRPEEVSKRFQGDPLLETVFDWSSVWFQERELLHFHDPLAAVALVHPDVCSYKRGTISVELEEGEQQGVTHFTEMPEANNWFAASVNPDAFFSAYFSVFHTSR
jgi:purine nucleosidase